MADIELNNDHMTRDLSFDPVVNARPRKLTRAQIDAYNRDGYIVPLRVFDAAGVRANRALFDRLMAAILAANDGRDAYSINGYHLKSPELYDLVMNPAILDFVEDLIGPDIIGWGTHFFCKLPGDPKIVPWHQDASYWPFDKSRTVTAWLAIDDADAGNAAMQFIPGTHTMGHLKWENTTGPAVLNQSIIGADKLGKPVYAAMKAGEMSLHADMLAHGSDANTSDRRRCGLTIRYCPPSVRALTGWNQNAITCRGSDPSGHWPRNPRPTHEKV